MHKLIAVLAVSASALLPVQGRCGWENIRYSDAPLAVVYASTGAYEVAYTVGENCASQYELVSSPSSVWSGYLSLIPAEIVNQGLAGFDSGSAVALNGALWGQPPDASVNLLFSTEISSGISSPGVNVTQVYDNMGGAVNTGWPVTVSYSGADKKKLVIFPAADWPKGSVFSVYYSEAIVDINGSPVSGATTVYFSVLMDSGTNNTAAAFSDRRVRVVIPANSYSQDFFLTISTDASRPEILAANTRLAAQPGSPEFLNLMSVRSYDASGAAAQPNSACVVTLPYTDAGGDGIVDGSLSKLRAANLAVWRLDDERGLWVKQTGASIDTAARQVSQPVSHFSDYALMALPDMDVTPVYAFPVPFRPNAGNPARYGSWADGIRFTSPPIAGKIKIYTISGALVRDIDIAATPLTAEGYLKWDVKNSDGQPVASGVYLWEVTAGKNRKTGKLVVIK